MLLENLGAGLYWACVDFMIHSANLLGLTYRDTNAGMFFLLWPAVTLGLVIIVLLQRVRLRRLSLGRPDRRPSRL